MRAWHFIGETFKDGSQIPGDGEVLRHEGPLVMYEGGLQASKRLIDALICATGTTICRVSCVGEILHSDDRFMCRERTIIWRIDGKKVLSKFARWCAMRTRPLWTCSPCEDESELCHAAHSVANHADSDISRYAASVTVHALSGSESIHSFKYAANCMASAIAESIVYLDRKDNYLTARQTVLDTQNTMLTTMIEGLKLKD